MAGSAWRQINWWIDAGVSLPTTCGGGLRVLDTVQRVDCAFDITTYKSRDYSYIRFRTRLTDESGAVWECEEYVNPVALYEHALEAAVIKSGCSDDSRRPLGNKHGRYQFTPLFTDCPMETDTRMQRVLAIFMGDVIDGEDPRPKEEHVFFRFFEKYFGATLSLYEVEWIPNDTARETKGNIHYQLDIEFKADVESVVTMRDGEVHRAGGVRLNELNPVSVDISVMESAFHKRLIPNVRYSFLPEEDRWTPGRILVYRRLEETAEPNPAIRHEP